MELLQYSPPLEEFYNLISDRDGIEEVKILISTHPEILEESRSKMRSVLHSTAVYGRLEVMRYLLPLASNELLIERSKEMIDESEATCLYWAIYYNHVDVARLILQALISRGLEVDTWDRDERGVLSNYPSLEILQLFQELHPASLEFPDGDGSIAIHSAGHDIECLKFLLNLNPEWIHRYSDGEGLLPIHGAVENLAATKYLLSLDPDLLNVTYNQGWTLLHHAVNDGSKKVCIFLLQTLHFNLDAQTDNQETPFDIARRRGKSTLARILAACSSSVQDQLAVGLSEIEILEIREQVYFQESLVQRLLFR